MSRPIRVLIAKVGLDGHDRGAKFICQAFRDAGIEAIYTGIRQTPQAVVERAIQENVHAIGVSILSGAHNRLLGEIIRLLEEKEATKIAVFAGGIIPEQDVPELKRIGVRAVFGPGTPSGECIAFVRQELSSVHDRLGPSRR